MTIHRSKGLEFPIVILANASGQSRAHSEQILCDRTQGWIEVGIGPESERFSTVHYEEKLAHEKKCHEDEQKRLLYVAMTRARDKIILPKFTADEKKPSLLWSYLEKSLDGLEPQPLEISASALETFEKTTAVAPPQKNGDFEVLQELYEHFSPTAVAEVQPPTEALQISHGRNMGTLFHHTLERIDLKAKNHAMILQELCEEKGLLFLKPSVEALIERFYNMPIYARLCAAEAIYREVPWSYADQGRLFEGTIDCIFKDAEGYHILDYKTDQTLDESSETYAAYKEQIGFYAHAFERMFNLKPTSLILVFVSVEQEKIVL